MGALYSIQKMLAMFVGDIWVSSKMFALWPWPLIAHGKDETLVKGNDYRLFSTVLQPGDFIITTQNKSKGSNKAIPGTFKHLMVYTGMVSGQRQPEGNIWKPKSLGVDSSFPKSKFSPNIFVRTITHAESEGVSTFDLLDIFFHYDHLAVIRPWTTEEQQKIIVESALSQVGLEYNFDFADETNDDPRLYCTQLGTFCLQKAGIGLPKTMRKITRLWKPWQVMEVFAADFFAEAFPVVSVTMQCNDPGTYRHSAIGDLMRKKILNAVDATQCLDIQISDRNGH